MASDSVARLFLADEDIILSGLTVALQGDGSNWMIGRFGRQTGQADAELVLLEVHLLAGSKESGGLHLRLQTGNRDVVAGPKVHVHVKRVALSREARIIRAARLARIRAVDGVTVAAQPLPDFRQDTHRFFWDGSVGARTDVQQIVARVARARNQILDDAPRALPIVIGALISPAVIQRHAGLPRASLFVSGDLLLRRGEITGQLVAVIHDDVRL